MIPYTTITNSGLIKCIKCDIDIEEVGLKENVLVGLVKNLKMEGIDCILNTNLMGEK